MLSLARTGAVIGLSAAAALTACSSLMPHFPPPAPTRTTVEVVDDRFEASGQILGVDDVNGTDIFNWCRSLLRSWVNKTDLTIRHQFYVEMVYEGEWQFFVDATGQDANALEFTEIDRKVISCGRYGGCTLSEHFGATLPDSLLQAHRQTGYAVKFRAKSGAQVVVAVLPSQIEAQLGAVGSYVRDRRPK